MMVGFRIEGQKTNTEQNNHKNDGIVKCQNENSFACNLFEAAYFCLKYISLVLVKDNVFNVDWVRKITVAEALRHFC